MRVARLTQLRSSSLKIGTSTAAESASPPSDRNQLSKVRTSVPILHALPPPVSLLVDVEISTHIRIVQIDLLAQRPIVGVDERVVSFQRDRVVYSLIAWCKNVHDNMFQRMSDAEYENSTRTR